MNYLIFSGPVKEVIKVKKPANKCCGPEIYYADKQVGPNPLNENKKSLLKCNSGFHGFSSIKKEQDLLDLAGVIPSAFYLLLKASIGEVSSLISKGDGLLIFLLKMKLGLTYSSIGVLFGLHRTTISKIFNTNLMYLAESYKDFVQWLSKQAIISTMVSCFKETYPTCRVIIDCTEFKVEELPRFLNAYIFIHTIKKVSQ